MIKRIDLAKNFQNHKEEYLQAIEAVCKETAFSGGKYADLFDEQFAKYLGVPYVQGVNNGTSALHCACVALGIKEGDEVIVPANTYIASAWGVTYTGATPVFVDCTSDTWEIDPCDVEKKITSKTKAIIGVHLYGQPFDYKEIKKIADKYGLFVIEDCAQAHGAKFEGKMVGTLGDMGCFSFYPGKNLYAFGEGGAISTFNQEYSKIINVMKNQGCETRYHHDMIGYNYRLEGIQGAILSVSLKYLPEWTKRRQQIGNRYMKEISNSLVILQSHPNNTEPVFHLFEIEVKTNPDKFINYMNENGIECHRHYPIPCHLQNAYKYLGYKEGDFPNAEYLAKHCVTLPLYPELSDREVEYIINRVNNYIDL